MKKLVMLAAVLASTAVVSACSFKEKLYITNWGEYISDDVVEAFEDEFGVKVVITELISNELMYADLKQDSYPCDVVFPSDYMVEKLASEDLIEKLDYTKLDNFTSTYMYSNYLDTLIRESGYSDYMIPYFWGSLGIMYNTTKSGVEDIVESLEWGVFFEEAAYSNYDVAMYDSSRDSFAAATMYLRDKNNDSNYSINAYTETQLDECVALLSGSGKYSMWGDDNIKGRVSTGNADIGLVYSGDFFDQLYADDYESDDYNIYIPTTNNVFFDAMCIPTNSQSKDLAYEFINFMMDFDNAFDNALEVGYCPAIQSVLTAVEADVDMQDIISIPAWNPQNLLKTYNNAYVYKDLGATYALMETKFSTIVR